MASGIEHAAASETVAKALTVTGGVLAFAAHPVAVGLALGAWAAVICTPDLDHHMVTYCERRIRRANWLMGVLWSAYWWPYMQVVPHRGSSHTWPQGTAVRVAYLLWAPLLVSTVGLVGLYPVELAGWWLAVFVGWSLVDMRHLWMDGLRPWGGRRRWLK
jgi:uncharacterized metal-binding protein